jgi:hypothetical protein
MPTNRDKTKAHLLATMVAVSPPLEKLMTERAQLRAEIRSIRTELEHAGEETAILREMRDSQIPRYIGIAKAVSLTAATCALFALITSLFTGLIDPKITTPLLASALVPLSLVVLAEQRFGRWHLHLTHSPTFVRNDREV